jgi:hypothetical protein
LTILISALPVQGELLTVQKSDRVKLQIKQNINDIKETKWFIRDIDDNLISIQPDNKKYNEEKQDTHIHILTKQWPIQVGCRLYARLLLAKKMCNRQI